MNNLMTKTNVKPILATGLLAVLTAVALASLNLCIFVLVDEVKTPVSTLQRYKARNDI